MTTRDEINKIIARYAIERVGDNLGFRVPRGHSQDEARAIVGGNKPEIMAELLRREQEAADKEAARIEEARAIRADEVPIRVRLDEWDGIPLYVVYGEAAEALKEIGAARVIAYSTQVNKEIIDTLGMEFTFSQASEVTRPAREAMEAARLAKEGERQARFDEARRTGQKVKLRSWIEDCNDPREECSTDSVTEYAMPDGTTEIVRLHTW